MRGKEEVMTNPILVVFAILALAALYVFMPIMVGAYRRFRGHWVFTCPETGGPADVDLDGCHAAITSAFGTPHPRVKNCSLWPKRKDCPQTCLRPAQ
jgi:hypothetical protein